MTSDEKMYYIETLEQINIDESLDNMRRDLYKLIGEVNADD